ncbi:MAG: helix-turn-helix transcriptional regulator [Alphaproteobacteria bacterium]|nr:helix-turn-helix transcriptional regulator [Alphaproteobacteria bacterium]
MPTASPFARELRAWRKRRGLSQLDLALRAETTSRHLSFLETGRSRPSAEMVLRLSRCLDVPLRHRNQLLRAAGHPAAYAEHPLDAAALSPVRAVIDRMLAGHAPYPAYVVDGRWRLIDSNDPGARMWAMLGVDRSSGNVLRAFLESPVAAAMLDNHAEVAWQSWEVLQRDVIATGDEALAEDLAAIEVLLARLPRPATTGPVPAVLCPRLRLGDQVVRTFTTICRLGNAGDVTLDELRVELVFPADAPSDAFLRALADPAPPA